MAVAWTHCCFFSVQRRVRLGDQRERRRRLLLLNASERAVGGSLERRGDDRAS
jgi:hypothetical protein